ncbi:MAG: hypothetical protein U9Q63_03695 [Patescibacteria group bacterium]|nr:hypothetical protein [Patescibacteria group bacterium]
MKKLIILTTIFLLLLLPTPLIAEEASESGNSNLTDKIKEKLQETTEKGFDNIKKEIVNKSKTPKRKAFIGKIKSINQSNLTLEYKSQIFNITLNENTNIVKSSGKKTISVDDLNIDDFVIAMGFVSPDAENLIAHRILLISIPKPSISRQLLNGKINEIDGNKVSIDSKSLVVTGKTNLKIKDIEDPKVEDLRLDDSLFAIVTMSQNGDIQTVKQILVLPGKNNPASIEPTNLPAQASATESAEATDSAFRVYP